MNTSGHETILVVDDEPALSAMLEDALGYYGYKILQANSAEQALNMIRSNHVDLIISDISMPGMDGFELYEQVRREFPQIKFQLVSGYNDNIDKNTVLHKKILYKPFQNNELFQRVRALLDT